MLSAELVNIFIYIISQVYLEVPFSVTGVEKKTPGGPQQQAAALFYLFLYV